MPRKIDLSLFDDGAGENIPPPSAEATPTSLPYDSISTTLVPNSFPKISSVPYRIAIVGESPGKDESEQLRPFVGWSGKELDRFLSRFGILRDACYIGNVCQIRPPYNKLAYFDWDGPQIQSGIRNLQDDLKAFSPNIVLLLGGAALHWAKCGPSVAPPKRKQQGELVFAFPNSISDWRGSFFTSSFVVQEKEVKCIASYHPAACLRQYEWTPLLMMDIQRCVTEASTKELVLPKRELKTNLSFEELSAELDKLSLSQTPLGCDIEGTWEIFKCITFSLDPLTAVAVPFCRHNGQAIWTLEQETILLRKVLNIISNPKVSKVWQNGLYDRYAFQKMGIVVKGKNRDIMLRHWELYCELEKNLGVQASLYTREPFYKEDRESEDWQTFLEYACKDSAITKEIDLKLEKCLSAESKRHTEFNETLLSALLYMQTRGLNFNIETAKARQEVLSNHLYSLQADLDTLTGYGIKTQDRVLLRSMTRDHMCYVRNASQVKKGFDEDYNWQIRTLLMEGKLTKSEIGRISSNLELSLNIEGKDFKPYLYDILELPVQKDPKTKQPTSDYEALQTLLKLCKQDHKSIKAKTKDAAIRVLPLCVEIGECKTRLEHISSLIRASRDFSDGRIHSFYNEVGSETGRVTCGKLFKKYGYPLQTVEDENDLKPLSHPLRLGLRDLISADRDCYLGKCDLKGADGWTIGAQLASLGRPNMLDDLRFGLKPAHFPCYEHRHGRGSTTGKSREELKELFKEIKKEDWDYFGAKQCTWGFFYLLGLAKAAQHIFNVSEGTVYATEEMMSVFKDVLFRRYDGPTLHAACQREIRRQQYPPKLLSPSGHTRMFFGRPQEILGEWLAHLPQSVTTYATNMAVFRCWTDPENRIRVGGKVKLKVEPMHQVHDEFLCQFKIEDLEFAKRKMPEWFNNPITISGITITIPYDGAYGTDWSMNEHSKKGNL